MIGLHERKLGRLPAVHDPRTLRLAHYMQADLPTVPEASDWSTTAGAWTTMGNNEWGDCVFATKGHVIQTHTGAKTGSPIVVADQDVIDLYRKYSPRDAGYNILASMKLWRTVGFWGYKIWAFADVSGEHDHIKAAIHLFGAVEFGVNLPIAWKDDEIWDTGSGRRYTPGSWGGHSVPAIKYDAKGVWVVSWGELVFCTWAAVDRYIDEYYCMISPDWIGPGGTAPNGFDLAKLHFDLKAVSE